jgi:hypothetical protein
MAETTTGTETPKHTDADYEGVQRVNRELQEGKRLPPWAESAGWKLVDGKPTPPQATPEPAPKPQTAVPAQGAKRVRRADFLNPDTGETDEDAYEAARDAEQARLAREAATGVVDGRDRKGAEAREAEAVQKAIAAMPEEYREDGEAILTGLTFKVTGGQRPATPQEVEAALAKFNANHKKVTDKAVLAAKAGEAAEPEYPGEGTGGAGAGSTTTQTEPNIKERARIREAAAVDELVKRRKAQVTV